MTAAALFAGDYAARLYQYRAACDAAHAAGSPQPQPPAVPRSVPVAARAPAPAPAPAPSVRASAAPSRAFRFADGSLDLSRIPADAFRFACGGPVRFTTEGAR